MKKFYIYLSVFALTVLAAGCAKELQDPNAAIDNVITVDETTGESIVTVTLSVPESSDTKTTLGTKDGSSYPVFWSAGDVITLNGLAAAEFTPESGNETATAKFAGKDGSGNGIAINSPYNFLYGGVSGQSNQVTFPASQSYVANGFDPAAMPMYASVTNLASNITFSHVGALLRFSFTGTNKIDRITLTAADASKSLSGTFTIGATAGILDGSLTPAATGASLSYDFGGHIQLSDTPFVFYVAIPAGTYEGGINLTIVDNASGHMNVTVMDSNATKTIAAGKVREFDNVVYIPAKENNLKQIYDNDTFNAFVSAVAGGNKTLNARLTQNAATLSLSAATISAFNSIEGYKGTFDGNNKTISGLTKPMFDDLQGVVKNLTLNSTISTTSTDRYWGIFANSITPSLEVDDVPGLQNCIASGSITWTPSSEISSYMALGGLVGDNKGGTITGCTNNATVTFADGGVTHTNQPSVGGVVGRTQKGGDLKTQGEISNCTNNGTVTVAAKFSQGAYIGGVLGYQVEKAETMSGCVNHGLVKVTSTFSTGGALHLGGVAGMAKGIVENCTNASDGTVTAEACSVSTYLCQGGVVGRLNREADSYSGLANAGTVNAAAAGPSATFVGGVVGRCNEGASITEFTNSGNINASMTGSSGTTFIGGIVSRITTSLSNCSTTGGTLEYTGTNVNSPLYIGGIVAYTNQADVTISGCTNAMTINVGGSFSPASNNYFGTGGIIGNLAVASATVSGCLNTGNITWSQQLTTYGYSFLGGVAGRADGTITDSSNGGTVSFMGQNAAQPPYIGGLVGDSPNNADKTISGKYSSVSATNYGSVIVNTSTPTEKDFYVGGVVGRLRCNLENATNAGPITITQLTCSVSLIGGVAGYSSRPINSGSANLSGGVITVTSLTANGSSDYYATGDGYAAFVGGVVGEARGSVTATNAGNIAVNGLSASHRAAIGGVVGTNKGVVVTGTNSGNVSVSNGSTFAHNLFVGGVVGHGKGNITSCTNSGSVSNAAPVTASGKFIQLGGVAGYNESSAPISSCHNTGSVTNTGNSAGNTYVGGITSESDAEISECDNIGNVSNSGSSGNNKWIAVGGIAGYANCNITSCSNGTSSAAGGTISNSGTPDEDINVGGIAGNNAGKTFTSCYNKGAVTNTGNAREGYNVNLGGLVGWSSANSTYVTCHNSGALSNYGIGSNTDAACGVRLGGLVGSASGANTLSGDAENYNYNEGTILENSASERITVGGICAWTNNASTTLNYAQNKASGDITISGGTRYYTYVGGILGCNSSTPSFSYTKNAGDINFSGITVSRAVYAGGIHGGFLANGSQTITGCENTGAINCPQSGDNGGNMAASAKISVVTYIGGISSVAGNDAARTGKTFNNCINRGSITVYNQLWTRLGGCFGYGNVNPSGCENHGKIVYWLKDVKSHGQNGAVGGVIGFINIASVSNLTNTGGVQSTGSSPNCFTGGIVGQEGGNMNTMTNCYVGKSGINIVGAGSGSFGSNGAGLFVASKTAKAWTFTGCKVITGTKCQGSEITDSNMADAVVGRNHASSITDPPTLVSSF